MLRIEWDRRAYGWKSLKSTFCFGRLTTVMGIFLFESWEKNTTLFGLFTRIYANTQPFSPLNRNPFTPFGPQINLNKFIKCVFVQWCCFCHGCFCCCWSLLPFQFLTDKRMEEIVFRFQYFFSDIILLVAREMVFHLINWNIDTFIFGGLNINANECAWFRYTHIQSYRRHETYQNHIHSSSER